MPGKFLKCTGGVCPVVSEGKSGEGYTREGALVSQGATL